MPIIQVQMLEGRSDEKIKSLIARLTDVVSEELDAPKERVRVLVTEVQKTHWGVGGISVSDQAGRK